jgi:hypothetical protein
LEALSSVRSVPTQCNEDQLALWDSPETAVRRVGGWCEMPPACKVVIQGAEERPLLKDVTKQRSEDRD